MRVSKNNIKSSNEYSFHFLGISVQFKSKAVSRSVIIVVLILLVFITSFILIIKSLINDELIFSSNITKGIGGAALGVMLIYLLQIIFYLFQTYLDKLKEHKKRQIIEEKYSEIKEKIKIHRLYVIDKFKDAEQIELLKMHLKKLEEEELNNEIEKIEELKSKV